MNAFKITFADGNVVYTKMNATLTEAEAYYLGNSFQFGDTRVCRKDRLVVATSVVLLS